jgi:adhesin transport system membrane fusion protein
MDNHILKPEDQEYINSLSEAILQKSPYKMRIVLYIWAFVFFAFVIWASFSQIDELVRGEGEIVPSGENKVVQNLEGGIVEQILVSEGQTVKKGQVLLRIDNKKSETTYTSTQLKVQDLQAQSFRLKAEATMSEMKSTPDFIKNYPDLYEREKHGYMIDKEYLESQIGILREQEFQAKAQLSESKTRSSDLKHSLALIQEEVAITQPLVQRGVKSKVDFLKLQREQNDILERYNTSLEDIPRLNASMREIHEKISEAQNHYMSDAQQKLNDVMGELQRAQTASGEFQDQVDRTKVISPVNGRIQKLYVHTIGGVIKPGDNLVEIVPSEATLWVEVNIKPADIAFIYPTQKAIIKITAYDFAVFGALQGEVASISADTIKDDKGNRFYKVKIRTKMSQIENNRKIVLMPGMTVNADIVTGEKSVMDYILKPILKTKQYMFSER